MFQLPILDLLNPALSYARLIPFAFDAPQAVVSWCYDTCPSPRLVIPRDRRPRVGLPSAFGADDDGLRCLVILQPEAMAAEVGEFAGGRRGHRDLVSKRSYSSP